MGPGGGSDILGGWGSWDPLFFHRQVCMGGWAGCIKMLLEWGSARDVKEDSSKSSVLLNSRNSLWDFALLNS